MSKHSEHGDAAVLDLDLAEAVKASLVLAFEERERIPETERGLSSNLVLERHGESSGPRRLGRKRRVKDMTTGGGSVSKFNESEKKYFCWRSGASGGRL